MYISDQLLRAGICVIGHTSVDRGAVLGSRFDGKRSIQKFQTLLHADKAKPSVRLCTFDVKAHPRIPDREMNLI